MYENMREYMSLMQLDKMLEFFDHFAENPLGDRSEILLGRLATKTEPAGKIRVFAMVDI